ncbi:MAG TPA: hypothetical protein VIV40_33245 [Kofleriaceae bacterium]
MRRLLVLVWLALFGSRVYAETIAMLPLDGEKRLEIYGQPVAAEIARALRAAGLDVVVVGARMEVPDRAQLIVDGTIKAAKNKQIELSIRVRDPRDGTVLDTLPAPATKLDDLDKAAADLSARVVPSVKANLEKLAKPAVVDKPITDGKPVPQRPMPPPLPTLATSVTAHGGQTPLLAAALDREAALWAATQRYSASVKLDVIGYKPQPGKPPMARARVHVVISGGATKFDRVMRTDTIVGDANSTPEQLAERTAREVLAILRPNLRRVLGR